MQEAAAAAKLQYAAQRQEHFMRESCNRVVFDGALGTCTDAECITCIRLLPVKSLLGNRVSSERSGEVAVGSLVCELIVEA
eukprot:3336293-Amphidinium_carterae.1